MSQLELREVDSSSVEGRVLSGYAAVFRSPSVLLPSARGPFVETIEPGAFSRSLREGRVWAYYGHDDRWPLARTPETLQLSEDSRGLRFSMTLPDTTYGNDVAALIEGGVLEGKMSFGFRTKQDRWERRGDALHRTLIDVDLVEVSVVREPAYAATGSSLRGMNELTTSRCRLALRVRAVGDSDMK